MLRRSWMGVASVDLSKLVVGAKGMAELVVGPEHTAPRVGSGRVAVLATPVMINLIEAAALAAAEDFLPSGHQSLGILPGRPPLRCDSGCDDGDCDC